MIKSLRNRVHTLALVLGALLVVGQAAAADRSGVRPGLLNTPTGPGSIQGLGESFDANPNAGTSSYSVKVAVPPGVAGYEPEIALSYSSGGGNTELGLGWAIPVPQVQRSTDKALPSYTDDDTFVLKAMGARGAEDLVEMADGSYRFRIEGAFAKGARRDDGSWSFRAKNGELFRFGTSSDSRIESGKNVFAWLLAERVDTYGNVIRYEYEKSGGRPYLMRIVYNDSSPEARNVVEFVYQDRFDDLASYISGFKVELTRRLATLVVKHGKTTVRTYSLSYDDSGSLSRLRQVELVGMRGDRLPALSLGYVGFAPDDAKVVTMKSAPARALGATSELDDVNGDGLPDLLIMDDSAPAGAYSWYENVDGSSFGSSSPMTTAPSVWLSSSDVELADLDGDSVSDVFARISAASDGLRYYPGAASSGFGSSVVVTGAGSHSPAGADAKLVDLNHDRLPDILTINATTGRMTVAFNLGGGKFKPAAEVPEVTTQELVSFATGLQLTDVNGDGLADLASIRSESLRYWPSLGFGKFAPVVQVSGAPKLEGTEAQKAQLRDLNGDGLSDLVVVGATRVRYWLNIGGKLLAKAQTIDGTPEVTVTTEVRVADMNANGTADIVWVDPTGAAPWRYLDLMPKGTPGLLQQIENGLGKKTTIEYAGLGTMRAWARKQGVAWTTRCPIGQTVVARIENATGLNPSQVTEYRYANGYYSPEFREFRGFNYVEVTEIGDADQPSLLSRFRFLDGADDEAKKGLQAQVERMTAKGDLFDRAALTYETRTVAKDGDGDPLRFAVKRMERKSIYELTDEPVILESEFDYDNFGNVILEAQYGQVSGKDRAFGDDERVVVRTFAKNEDLWIVDRLASEVLQSFDGVRVSEQRTYYDGEPFKGLPLGSVERGSVTRMESWIRDDYFAPEKRTKYDVFGNPVEVLDARGLKTIAEYDPSGAFLTRERQYPSKGTELAWSASYDEALGTIASVVGPNDATYSFAYDGLGRVTKIAEPGDDLDFPTKAYQYVLGAPTSYIKEELLTARSGKEAITQFYYFDGDERELATLEEGTAAGEWIVSGATSYGARGKESGKPYAAFVKSADLPDLKTLPRISLSYDAQLRVVRKVEGDGALTRTEYLQLGHRVFDPNDTDESSPHFDTPTLFVSDGLDRLVEVTERQGKQDLRTARYSYDAAGQLLSWVDAAGHPRRYAYDGRSRRVSIDDPNAGLWRFEFTDGDDRLSRTDPTGRFVSWAYDDAGRKTQEIHRLPSGELKEVATFHYDEAASDGQSNVAGQLSWAEDEAGSVFFGYTARGLANSVVRRFPGGKEYVLSSGIDSQDRTTRRTFPDGSYYDFTYDSRGLMESAGPFARDATWTASGALRSVTWGNGVQEERSYDVRQRLTTLRATKGKRVLRDQEISYDAAGLVRGLDDRRASISPKLSLSAQFTYDDRGRLAHRADALGTTQWAFDEVGNVLTVKSDSQRTPVDVQNSFGDDGAGPDAMTRFGDEKLSYDAAGRLVKDGSRLLEWDALGRLVAVVRGDTREEYTYGFDDQRAVKRTTTSGATTEVLYLAPDAEVRDGKLVRYVMFAGDRLARLDAVGRQPAASSPRPIDLGRWGIAVALLAACSILLFAIERSRTRIRGGRLALACATALSLVSCGTASTPILEVPPETVFWIPDHQHTALVLADVEGKPVESRSHDPYGALLDKEGNASESYGFVGNEIDLGVGLSDFNARPYRPEAGIFLAPDPVAVFSPEEGAAEPRTAWAYAYAGASPVTLDDPAGLQYNNIVLARRGGDLQGERILNSMKTAV